MNAAGKAGRQGQRLFEQSELVVLALRTGTASLLVQAPVLPFLSDPGIQLPCQLICACTRPTLSSMSCSSRMGQPSGFTAREAGEINEQHASPILQSLPDLCILHCRVASKPHEEGIPGCPSLLHQTETPASAAKTARFPQTIPSIASAHHLDMRQACSLKGAGSTNARGGEPTHDTTVTTSPLCVGGGGSGTKKVRRPTNNGSKKNISGVHCHFWSPLHFGCCKILSEWRGRGHPLGCTALPTLLATFPLKLRNCAPKEKQELFPAPGNSSFCLHYAFPEIPRVLGYPATMEGACSTKAVQGTV